MPTKGGWVFFGHKGGRVGSIYQTELLFISTPISTAKTMNRLIMFIAPFYLPGGISYRAVPQNKGLSLFTLKWRLFMLKCVCIYIFICVYVKSYQQFNNILQVNDSMLPVSDYSLILFNLVQMLL